MFWVTFRHSRSFDAFFQQIIISEYAILYFSFIIICNITVQTINYFNFLNCCTEVKSNNAECALPLSAGPDVRGGWTSNQIFKKGSLTGPQPLEGVANNNNNNNNNFFILGKQIYNKIVAKIIKNNNTKNKANKVQHNK